MPPPSVTSPSSPALAKATGQRSFLIILATVVVVGSVAGWLILRSSRARREAIAKSQMSTLSPAAGDDLVAARALANYLVRLRAQVREHENAFLRLQQQKALSWHIRDLAEIERDRQIVRDFLATNARLTDTLKYGDGFIRAELNTAKVPASARDTALALYAKSQGPVLPLQMRVRRCDEVIGENALAVLNLLDLNWGTWTRDEPTGRLDFTNSITFATFQDYVAKIDAAARERAAAQEELSHYLPPLPQP